MRSWWYRSSSINTTILFYPILYWRTLFLLLKLFAMLWINLNHVKSHLCNLKMTMIISTMYNQFSFVLRWFAKVYTLEIFLKISVWSVLFQCVMASFQANFSFLALSSFLDNHSFSIPKKKKKTSDHLKIFSGFFQSVLRTWLYVYQNYV